MHEAVNRTDHDIRCIARDSGVQARRPGHDAHWFESADGSEYVGAIPNDAVDGRLGFHERVGVLDRGSFGRIVHFKTDTKRVQ